MKIILYLFYWNPPLVYQMIYVAMLAYLPGTGATSIQSSIMANADSMSRHIDVDMLKRTVRMVVTGPRRHTVTRFEVVQCLLGGGLPGEVICSVFRCESPNTWFVTVEDEVTVDSIVERGPIKEKYFTLSPDRCDQRRLTVRVQWLPSWIADDSIAEYFAEFFGKVVNISRETTAIGKVTLETGTRVITLIIREGDQDRIPYKAKLFGKTALIMVPGRPPVCLRCQQVGHVRSQCPGRPTETGRGSYASKVAGSTASLPPHDQVPASQPEQPVPEQPTEESASPSSGGSGALDITSGKRGPEVDEEGFQVTKRGKHSASSPALQTDGTLVPGQDSVMECDDGEGGETLSVISEGDWLVIDLDSGGSS
ncbi:hypothetical protein CI610_03352 [invertebrate metagenome]|uniref:CCHC-type domain-containing protein n=1 Tax=invertebrate metagenome TaxID=1711999 RepID=A0A2H9T3B7_9ZZZZ